MSGYAWYEKNGTAGDQCIIFQCEEQKQEWQKKGAPPSGKGKWPEPQKKKKRTLPFHLQKPSASVFRSLTDAEADEMREEIKRDIKESKVFGDEGPIIVNSGKEKMSEILIDFARPFLDELGDEMGTNENIIALCVVGWNMAIVSPGERRALMRKVLHAFPESQRSIAEDLLRLMEERKLKYFKGINRIIVNYRVKEDAESLNVFVASTPTEEQMAEIGKK